MFCIHVFTHFFTVSNPDLRPERDLVKSKFMNRDIDRFFNCCNIYEINIIKNISENDPVNFCIVVVV